MADEKKAPAKHTAVLAEGVEASRAPMGDGVERVQVTTPHTGNVAALGSFEFDADKFTEAKAREWLAGRSVNYLRFVAA